MSRSRLGLTLSCGLIAACVGSLAYSAEPTAAPIAEPIDLLASMDLWQRQGGCDDSFVLKDGVLQTRWARHEPAILLTRREFENFELSFACRMERWCESGLFLHAPWNGAVRAGLEIELSDHEGYAPDPHRTGAIFRHVAPKSVAIRKAGEWNEVQVRLAWPMLKVVINEQIVQDLDMSAHPDLADKLRRGAIGIQHNGWGIEFRDMKIRPLPDTDPALALFNGKDLTGWRVAYGQAKWQVRDGCIVGSDGDGYLLHEKACKDFDLWLFVRTSPCANGGVYFRWEERPDGADRGLEIQIFNVAGSVMPTGSVYGLTRGDDTLGKDGQWQLMQIKVRGNSALTYIDGLPCAMSEALNLDRIGHIVLQMHRSDAQIEFKDLHLRLPVPEPAR